MVKNNKTAIKGLLVLGGVSTAAASVYTLSKKYIVIIKMMINQVF